MKGKITIDNYEAWLLDRLEGRLTASQELELQNFLILHPELAEDVCDFTDCILPEFGEKYDRSELLREFDARTESLLHYVENQLSASEKIEFECQLKQDAALQSELQFFLNTILQPENESLSKAFLIKSEDDLLLASPVLNFTENQLTEADRKVFLTRLMKEPALHSELQAYQATILQPDLSITYPDKNALVRSGRIIPLFGIRVWQFSAAAVLVLFLLGFLYQSSNSSPIESPVGTALSNLSLPSKNAEQENQNLAENSKVKSAKAKKVQPSPLRAQNKKVISKTSKQTELAATKQSELTSAENPVAISDTVPPVLPLQFEAGDKPLKYASVDDLETTEELTEFDLTQEKTSVWHKAVDLAKRFNKMGFTAVNGMEERKTRSYRLSFNSFTVEKK